MPKDESRRRVKERLKPYVKVCLLFHCILLFLLKWMQPGPHLLKCSYSGLILQPRQSPTQNGFTHFCCITCYVIKLRPCSRTYGIWLKMTWCPQTLKKWVRKNITEKVSFFPPHCKAFWPQGCKAKFWVAATEYSSMRQKRSRRDFQGFSAGAWHISAWE